MKEQKNSTCVKDLGKYPNTEKARPNRNKPQPLILDFDFRIGFQVLCASLLLIWIGCQRVNPTFITNCSVGNKIHKYLGYCLGCLIKVHICFE
jgi:hypothetical protein